jgi:hypothetical protein
MSFGDIAQGLRIALVLLVLWVAVAMPVLKFSARGIPFGRLALVALWTFLCVIAIIATLAMLSTLLLHRPLASPPFWVVVIAFLVGGWLMDLQLRQMGIEAPFPGIGARVMTVAFLTTVAGFALMLWYYAAPTHQL